MAAEAQQTHTNKTFTKPDVGLREYAIHKLALELGLPAPPIFSYDWKERKLTMGHIEGRTVAEMYGENGEECPAGVWEEIRGIVRLLFENGIEYRDITAYNFMEDALGKIWVVDFERARFLEDVDEECVDAFVPEFILGRNEWNPDFQ